MKTNKLKSGLKSHKKLKDSFYYFIVDNRIDWAIILGSIFCILPYLASHDWRFIIIKSSFLITIIYISLRYLKTWNSLRDVDTKMNDGMQQFKNGIKKEKINSSEEFLKFQSEFSEKINTLLRDYKSKTSNYKNFNEYLKYDKEIPSEFDDFLRKDTDMTRSALNFSFGLLLKLTELRELPKLRLFNYYRLLFIILLTFVFFITYTIENSI